MRTIPRREPAREKWGWLAAAALLIAWSFSASGEELAAVFTREGLNQAGRYAARFWPPATGGAFLKITAHAALETLAISIGGTAIAAVIAGALLYFAASEDLIGAGGEWDAASSRSRAGRRALYYLSRAALNLFRTIPEIVWAIFFVFAVGLGGFAGTLAIAIHNVRFGGAEELLVATMRRQFELCTRAAHISLLTDRYQGFADHILPWRAEQVLGFALEISPNVVLRHDYLPNDFSVTLYREPLIDTRPGLLLD